MTSLYFPTSHKENNFLTVDAAESFLFSGIPQLYRVVTKVLRTINYFETAIKYY